MQQVLQDTTSQLKSQPVSLSQSSFILLLPSIHYDALTFQERCVLALVAEWEALGEPEQTAWTIKQKDKLQNIILFELQITPRSHRSPDPTSICTLHFCTWTPLHLDLEFECSFSPVRQATTPLVPHL
eukprot:4758043-Prymnesium_polylepis.1